MEPFALIPERARCRPRLDDKIDALLKQLAVLRWIGVIGELLAARTAHPSRHQQPTRDDVHHRHLLAQAERRAVMLIEHYAVEVQKLLVSVNLLVDVLVEDLRTVLGLEEA